jgi:hypothetical protein
LSEKLILGGEVYDERCLQECGEGVAACYDGDSKTPFYCLENYFIYVDEE